MSPLEHARLRVMRSRWIPLYLCALLLAYGCAAQRQHTYRSETPTPTVSKPL